MKKDFLYFKKSRWLLLTLLTMIAGMSPTLADTLSENFDDIKRLDANGNEITSNWTYGYSLSNGWFVSPAAGVISASNSYHYGIATGGNTGNALWAAYGSTQSYYMVIPTQLVGEVTFKAKKTSSSSSTKGYISLYEVTEDNGTFTVTSTQLGSTVEPTTNSTWNNYSINIGDEGKYVALHMIRSGLDNFEAEIYSDNGGVAKPTAFTVTSTTYNSATFSWTAGGEETAWQLVYDTNADFDKDAATPVDITENPYTLTDLSDGTIYYAYLRAKMGGDVSSWTSKISFTTPEQFPKPTDFEFTSYTATTATFSWTAGGSETAWQIGYSTTEGFDPADATIVDVTVNPYTLEGLTAETTYYARIRANYSSGFSAWSDEINFTPSTKLELTVNDGTSTNSYVPFYGQYVDTQGTMSQFIIPASSLTSMTNRQITKMTFYGNKAQNWNAKFKVFVTEVSETTFSSKECDWSGMEEVAEATVTNDSNGEMVIEFDTPYDYSDGNLMVGFNLTTTGSYTYSSWYGVNSGNNTARYSYSGYSGVENAYATFIPKVTITSIPGSDVPKPKMAVTQPESLDYGIITAASDKTFTITNTGNATLEGIIITSSNAAFVIKDAPATLEAGNSAVVTITMSATTTGEQSSTINISASNVTKTVEFTVKGIALPANMSVVDFEDNQLPARWENSGYNGGWTFTGGTAYAGYSSSTNRPVMNTPKIVVNDDDDIVLKAKLDNTTSIYYVTVRGSSDNGATWTAYSKKMDSNTLSTEYKAIVLSDIPATVNRLQFEGYYATIDEIWGINYAPALSVTTGDPAAEVATPANYDFGECPANASVTYNFANAGAGTINITNVEITGDGAAAYSTNWTESVAAPFDLTITRSYDADRTEPQEAVVTVTTSEGEFVINVTGTDKAANAPELAVTLGGEAVATGDAANFGTKLQAAPSAKTYTITNSGTGTLTGTIATSDDTQFTVSKTEFSLGAAESTTFDLALVYNTTYGAKAATITIHPTVDGLEDIVINATASTLDPEAWTEDFSEGTLPTGWTQGTWTIGTYSSYENTTTMALAPSSSTAGTLITPRLSANKDDVLTWDAYFKWADEPLIVEYSNDDKQSWNAITTVYGTESGEKGSGQVNYHKDLSFTAPADGYYYIRFTSTYSNGVDNFNGFKLALKEHDVTITSQNIRSTFTQYCTYDVTVTVNEMVGKEEVLTAKFFIGDTQYGESVTETVEANGTKTFTVSVTLDDIISGNAHFTITNANISIESETVAITTNAAIVLDETVEPDLSGISTSAWQDAVVLKYTASAGWNTICVPFKLTDVDMEAIFGEGYKAYEFKSYNNGELGFSKATTFYAGYPIIVYSANPVAFDSKGYVMKVVQLSATSAKYDQYNQAYFRGTFAPVAAGEWTKNAEDDVVYGVTSAGKIAKAGANASINGFRAYFDLPAGATARLSFTDENGIVTVINAVELDKAANGEVYNLNGQRVEGMRKGLYIINGKKVVKK